MEFVFVLAELISIFIKAKFDLCIKKHQKYMVSSNTFSVSDLIKKCDCRMKPQETEKSKGTQKNSGTKSSLRQGKLQRRRSPLSKK